MGSESGEQSLVGRGQFCRDLWSALGVPPMVWGGGLEGNRSLDRIASTLLSTQGRGKKEKGVWVGGQLISQRYFGPQEKAVDSSRGRRKSQSIH